MIFIHDYLATAAQCSFTHDDDDYENNDDLFTFQFMLILRSICFSQQELFLLILVYNVGEVTAESVVLVVFKALKIIILERGVFCSFSEAYITTFILFCNHG